MRKQKSRFFLRWVPYPLRCLGQTIGRLPLDPQSRIGRCHDFPLWFRHRCRYQGPVIHEVHQEGSIRPSGRSGHGIR